MPAVPTYRTNRSQTHQANTAPVSSVKRVRIIYSCLLLITAVFVVRLFYLQVIKHDFYNKAALTSQLKQYEIPAERGTIYAYDGENKIPVVLNEKKYTLYADPTYVEDPLSEAAEIVKIIGGDVNKVSKLLKIPDTRYVILGKKLSKEQSLKIRALKFKGVGTVDEIYRTYPQGTLAASLLGFVNSEGKGQYGLEEYYNDELGGKAGFMKAITDRNGVPLAANQNNVLKEPKDGISVNLTIDVGIQRIVEDELKAGLEKALSDKGSVIVMDTHTGAVKAMASYPTFDPANYGNAEDSSAYMNSAVSDQIEPGSIMKPLLISAGLDAGVINNNYSYNNTGSVTIDGLTIKNSHQWGIPQEDLQGIMQRSLNTGVVSILQTAGGGTINEKARNFWYDYMINHYYFGKPTGIEQTAEIAGSIPKPNEGYALGFQYANTSFGQGVGVSLIQMAAAANSIVNGGTYWKPYIVDTIGGKKQEAKVVRANTVSKAASSEIVKIMTKVADVVYTNATRDGYMVGGKTGTAEIATSDGKYYTDRANGTFFGFVGGNEPDYVILVVSREPKALGSAGIAAAEPIFAKITQALINSGTVTPAR